MRFSLVIFDYDGVLIDSLDEALSAGQAYCRSISHDRMPTRETIASLGNMTYTELGRAVGLRPDRAEAFSLYIFERFQAISSSMAFFPGIEPLLHRLSSGNLAIVSGNSKRVISEKLAHHGLNGTTTRIYGALEPGNKAGKIRRACDHFGVEPGQSCMVGDSASDIRYARQAGVQSIAATWGWQSQGKLDEENPDFWVTSVRELSALIHSGEEKQ